MPNKKLIDCLNRALTIEFAAVIQYTSSSALVQGTDRRVYEEFFEDASKEARSHAKKVSDWIVSLGGVPSVETADVKQATEIQDMLQQALEVERAALKAYREAHGSVEEGEPIKFMLEEQIMTEQDDVWEIEKYLALLKTKAGKGRDAANKVG